MKKIILLLFLSATISSCLTDEKNARRVLENHGYTDIKFNGYCWYGCSEDDRYATEFYATTPEGHRVHGVVCGGYWKGQTIREF